MESLTINVERLLENGIAKAKIREAERRLSRREREDARTQQYGWQLMLTDIREEMRETDGHVSLLRGL
jgi:hypothetical protein